MGSECPTCGGIYLTGEDARKFEEEMNKPATQEEIEELKQAEEYYLKTRPRSGNCDCRCCNH